MTAERRPPRVGLAALLGAIILAAPAPALAAWTRAYAIEWNEPAMLYGGKGGPVDPGTDCPKGANPDPDWHAILVKAGYTPEEAKWLLDPGNKDIPSRQRVNQMAFRGKDRANVYADPTSTPDPGFVEVQGKVAEGINLDGDARTGFVSPTGEKGVDNSFYKALGCWKYLRGVSRRQQGTEGPNVFVQDGAWTLVLVVSGQGDDPLNDAHVRVGVYMSSDKLVKSGGGGVARDYTFRIRPHAAYEAIFEGKVAGGRITTEAHPKVVFRDAFYGWGVELLQARLDLQVQPNGGLKGYLGGYRPWRAMHDNFMITSGTTVENYDGIQLPALWYVLRRNADYSPTGPGGPKTHISFALRLDAVPAYVTDPGGKSLVAGVASYKDLAPKDEPLITYPRGGRAIIDGLYTLQPGQRVQPMTSEQMQAFLTAKPAKVATADAPR
ncbi:MULTISPECIES: hypothetical protein [unclassified Phenylobacterium]|uniref:hypothetical protein n=1 Tax=unclassified Phenylobacterium TaxID=2640670 RepID=UPI00083B199E|nr:MULTISPECIES: hypothetical protein [unclassified Phenylobacterium]